MIGVIILLVGMMIFGIVFHYYIKKNHPEDLRDTEK